MGFNSGFKGLNSKRRHTQVVGDAEVGGCLMLRILASLCKYP